MAIWSYAGIWSTQVYRSELRGYVYVRRYKRLAMKWLKNLTGDLLQRLHQYMPRLSTAYINNATLVAYMRSPKPVIIIRLPSWSTAQQAAL